MTYANYFQLKDRPFRLSPDIEYFFPSEVHKDIMRHLMYSINTEEGFVEITGEPGIGKTITLRSLVEQINEEVLISMIVNPTLSPDELLKAVALDFGLKPDEIDHQSSEHILRLIQVRLMYLCEQGSVAVIVIDEAQNLSDQTLEQICLISNIEIYKKKAVKIILVGQVELENNLQRPELKKIFQRITVRCRLTPLSKKDTILYINHRLRIAGGVEFRQPNFSKKTINMIYQYSNGLPRLINLICERSLMAAFAEKKTTITPSHVKKALRSFQPKEPVAKSYQRNIYVRMVLTAIIIFGLGVFAMHLLYNHLIINEKPRIQPLQSTLSGNKENVSLSNDQQLRIKQPLSAESAHKRLTINQQKSKIHSLNSVTTKEPSVPVKHPEQIFPEQLMTIPSGKQIIVFFPDLNRMVLWKYTGTKYECLKTTDFYANLREGIYLLGRDNKQKPFLLNPFIAQSNISDSLLNTLYSNLDETLPSQILPVIVYLSGKSFDSSVYDQAKSCCLFVKQWAFAWRSKNIEHYLNCFHKDGLQFYKLNRQPRHISWEQLKASKLKTFNKATKMSVDILNLNCIIDPANPKSAIAVFDQRYTTHNYSDEGIKVLFLSQQYQEKSKPNKLWQITGRFWIEINKFIDR